MAAQYVRKFPCAEHTNSGAPANTHTHTHVQCIYYTRDFTRNVREGGTPKCGGE